MKPLKVRISITLDDPIYQRIKGLAEYDDRSVSSYINLALRAGNNPALFYFSFCHSPTASWSQRLL